MGRKRKVVDDSSEASFTATTLPTPPPEPAQRTIRRSRTAYDITDTMVVLSAENTKVHISRSALIKDSMTMAILAPDPMHPYEMVIPDLYIMPAEIPARDYRICIELYARFIIFGGIESIADHSRTKERREDNELSILILCWIFGEGMESLAFQDACIDAIRERVVEDGANIRAPCLAYLEYIPSISPLRQLILDIAIAKWGTSDFDAMLSRRASSDFARDMLVRWAQIRDGTGPISLLDTKELCLLHVHAKGVGNCYKSSLRS